MLHHASTPRVKVPVSAWSLAPSLLRISLPMSFMIRRDMSCIEKLLVSNLLYYTTVSGVGHTAIGLETRHLQ